MSPYSSLKKICVLAADTFSGSIKSRFFTLFFIFAFILLYSSVLGSMLSISHEERVLADISLLLIEILCLVYAVFQVSSALSDEISSKSIYMVLSRPVPRYLCLLGKEVGVILSAGFITLVLSLMAIIVIRTRGLPVPDFFFWAVAGIFAKITIIISFSFLISLITTTNVSTFVLSFLLYILGHVTSQIEPLLQKAGGIKFALLKACAIIFPNLNLYSAREIGISTCPFTAASISAAFLWIIAAYILSAWLFSRKEF